MIVFASTLRTTRRPRRIPSVAAVVRALGTVRVSEHPLASSYPSATSSLPSRASVTPLQGSRTQPGAPRLG